MATQARLTIAVAGATGRLGRHVVEVLNGMGHHVVAISRSSGVDIVTGEGLAGALVGVECVIDVATGPSPDQKAATDFFTAAARNLQAIGEHHRVRRLVVVSIIGADRFVEGYGAPKVAHERALQAGSIPVRILRSAQFHEFVPQLVEWGRQGNVSYVPRMRTQLVAAKTVAERLVDLATIPVGTHAPGMGLGLIPEIAGPREESLVEVARLLAVRRADPAHIEAVSEPVVSVRYLYETGGLLPYPHAVLAGPTFMEWLESTAGPQPTVPLQSHGGQRLAG